MTLVNHFNFLMLRAFAINVPKFNYPIVPYILFQVCNNFVLSWNLHILILVQIVSNFEKETFKLYIQVTLRMDLHVWFDAILPQLFRQPYVDQEIHTTVQS